MQSPGRAVSLTQALHQIDQKLKEDNINDTTLQDQIVQSMRSLTEEGKARGFGQARAVPKRLYSLEDLRLNKIDAAKLLSPTEESIGRVEAQLQISFLLLLVTIAFTDGDIFRAGVFGFSMLFVLTLDQVSLAGGLRALAIDTAGGILNPEYRYANFKVA